MFLKDKFRKSYISNDFFSWIKSNRHREIFLFKDFETLLTSENYNLYEISDF